ncbi:MAG: DUF362 domain-containing protein [Pseudomonadota bacterium]
MHRVMIHPATYEDCRAAVDRAFELFPQNLGGKKVLIKPNVLRGAKPEDGITLHPAVLSAVLDRVEREKPAAIVVGDNPGVVSYGANEASFQLTGLLDAARGYYRNIGNDSIEVKFDPEMLDRVSVSRAVLDADVVISLPKFKTHGLTIITGALKNNYGILPGAQKAILHRRAVTPERFQKVVLDVFRIRPPDLFIVDAVVGMEGNGPASPDLRTINRVLASDNAVALDAVIARMMGLKPEALYFLREARDLGLGEFDAAAIQLDGELQPIPDFKWPPSLKGEQAISEEMVRLLYARTLVRPRADPEKCTRCGQCVDQCPVSALSRDGNEAPEVDPDVCIACFCCQEVCPEQAIALS